MTKIIGITGGIGSGKSTIANFFADFNIPIYIADIQAKEVMKISEIISEIKVVFGKIIFDKDILNRQKLAEIVFNNPQKLASLNAIIHPAVKIHFQNWLQNNQNADYVIYESAILFETGSNEICDFIITVTAPVETRIQRVIQRDNTTKEAVLNRINAQWNDQQRIDKSDFVIENLELEKTAIQVKTILKMLNILQ